MRKSLAVALLAVLFAAYPAAAQQPPGLAGDGKSDRPGLATGSPAGDDGDRQAPGMSRSGESSGDVTSLRRENAVLKRKVDLLEKQVELLRQRVRSLEGGQ